MARKFIWKTGQILSRCYRRQLPKNHRIVPRRAVYSQTGPLQCNEMDTVDAFRTLFRHSGFPICSWGGFLFLIEVFETITSVDWNWFQIHIWSLLRVPRIAIWQYCSRLFSDVLCAGHWLPWALRKLLPAAADSVDAGFNLHVPRWRRCLSRLSSPENEPRVSVALRCTSEVDDGASHSKGE